MKKPYEAPKVEIERYSLDASIASNCAVVVHNGPEIGDHQQCEDYEDPFAMSYSARSATYNVWFYEDTCDCYYSAADGGYWMS
ncbi:MAG: hypothetical protein ACI4S2_11625 [Lachnospiraceae bacterium]